MCTTSICGICFKVGFRLPHPDRIYVLERGRIVWKGSASRFLQEMGLYFDDSMWIDPHPRQNVKDHGKTRHNNYPR
jgi:hypothetical protein